MAYSNKVERYVFAYLSSSANTTITTSGTYYPILGTFTNSPTSLFSVTATPAIQYKDRKTTYFEIDWHASMSSSTVSTLISVGVKKNTVLSSPSIMTTFVKTSSESESFSGTVVLELSYDDEIQLVVTSDSHGDIITFENFTTTIREIK